MAHFKVGVIVPAKTVMDRQSLERFIEVRMAPFDENKRIATYSHNGEHCHIYNPNGRWDYYEVGGIWNGWLTDVPPEQSRFRDNIAPVEFVLENEKWPAAFITPDGLWIESSYDCERIVLQNFLNHYVVLLDAHV